MINVSQSKVNAWRTCRRKWWYRYGMNLRRRVKSRPLQFGSIIHTMLDANAQGKDPFNTLREIDKRHGRMFREEIEHYGDIITDVGYVMDEYFEYWRKEPLRYKTIQKRKAEHPFEIEIEDGITAKGKVDAIVVYRKMDAVLENKSHKDFPNEDHRWRNLQSSIYTRFMQMLGWADPEGSLWNYVRSKSPTRPKQLKDGGISKAQLDSLPSVVVDTIKSFDENPKDYAELVKKQEDNRSTWFKRVFTPNNEEAIDQIFNDFVESAREMAEHGHREGVRNIGKHCTWCDFEAICRASLTGADEEYVIEKEFTADEEESLDEAIVD